MPTNKVDVLFSTYKEASFFASIFSSYCNAEVSITSSGEFFRVTIPSPIPIKKISTFVFTESQIEKSIRDPFLSILDFTDNSQFSPPDLAWTDPETNLAWDRSGLIANSFSTDRPVPGDRVMSKVRYAGLSGWRLPTLNELKTLNLDKLSSARIAFSRSGNNKFWSSETTEDNGNTEPLYLDLTSMSIGHQHFREEHSWRFTPSDGYTTSARTLMVTSELKDLGKF